MKTRKENPSVHIEDKIFPLLRALKTKLPSLVSRKIFPLPEKRPTIWQCTGRDYPFQGFEVDFGQSRRKLVAWALQCCTTQWTHISNTYLRDIFARVCAHVCVQERNVCIIKCIPWCSRSKQHWRLEIFLLMWLWCVPLRMPTFQYIRDIHYMQRERERKGEKIVILRRCDCHLCTRTAWLYS